MLLDKDMNKLQGLKTNFTRKGLLANVISRLTVMR